MTPVHYAAELKEWDIVKWFVSKKGISPKNKDPNASHKILQFQILKASVRAYKNNLNTHNAYKEFREARSVKKDHFDAFEAAKHLKRYSQLKDEYVKILTKTIKTIISHKAKR